MLEITTNEIRVIATASEEQSATTEEISRSSSKIAEITTDAAESSHRANKLYMACWLCLNS